MNTTNRTVLKSLSRDLAAAAVALFASVLLAACGEDPPHDHASEPRPHLYVYGEKIGFGFGGDWLRFKGNGWAEGEQHFTWTKGLGAWMQVRVAASDEPLTLRMKMNGMINAPQLPAQSVVVSVNRKKIGAWKVGGLREYTLTIPREFVAAPPGADPAGHMPILVLDFSTPDSISPSELNVGRDPRRLGICVWEASITPGVAPQAAEVDLAPETPQGSAYTLSTPIIFGENGNSGRYKLSGWFNPDSTFTWVGKTRSIVGLRVERAERPLRLKALVAALVKPPKLTSQPMEVYVNGQKLATWQVGNLLQDFTADVPPELTEAGVLTIEFICPNAVSPNALQLSADLRMLGVQLHRLELGEAL